MSPTADEQESVPIEVQAQIEKFVKESLSAISPERTDRVIDLIEKLTVLAKGNPNAKGMSLVEMVLARGNFLTFPTESEIRSNPPKFVPLLESDLMVVFDILQRGDMSR